MSSPKAPHGAFGFSAAFASSPSPDGIQHESTRHRGEHRCRNRACDREDVACSRWPAHADLADDPVAVVSASEVADAVLAETDAVLKGNPALAVAVDATDRGALDFARFMHAAQTPAADVRAALESGVTAPESVEAVMAQLDVVEEALATTTKRRVARATPRRSIAPPVEEQEDSEVVSGEAFDDIELAAEEDDLPEPAPATDMSVGDSTGADSTALYLASLRRTRHDPPTPEHEAELGRRIKAGDEKAVEELTYRNLRYVVTCARRFLNTGRDFNDIIQAGNVGLMTAVRKFDHERGRFTTLAKWWIDQSIQRSVEADAAMPIPAYLPHAEKGLRAQAAEAATEEERDHLLSRAVIAGKRLAARKAPPVSLNTVRSGDDESEGSTLMDTLMAEDPSHAEVMERQQLIVQMRNYAERLGDERSRNIFLMRTGLHPDFPGDSRTLAELATMFDCTRERIRQIYAVAATDIADAMMYWAKGEENLPTGFRMGLTGKA
jgi:RNA polymerase sigma factor (sigma-70 family)